jgi:hypothetical protein
MAHAKRMLQLIPRTSLAARPGSVSLAWLIPANTSISPELTSRMCTITGWPRLASPVAGPAGRAGLAAAAAGAAIAAVMAPAARPAPARPAAPRMTERRDRSGCFRAAGCPGPGDSPPRCSVDMLIPSGAADRRRSSVGARPGSPPGAGLAHVPGLARGFGTGGRVDASRAPVVTKALLSGGDPRRWRMISAEMGGSVDPSGGPLGSNDGHGSTRQLPGPAWRCP